MQKNVKKRLMVLFECSLEILFVVDFQRYLSKRK